MTRSWRVVERNLTALKSSAWGVVIAGFFEPVFYLVSFGIGLGPRIGTITGPLGEPVSYVAFLAPALLATSAMNGALYDSTWNVFFKLRFARLYDAMVATEMETMEIALGEVAYALLRGLVYLIGFFAIMVIWGGVVSPWALLAIPAASLVAFAFSACGMALTTHFRTFQEMDWMNFVLLPMFLFSGTFFPLTAYPPFVRFLVEILPLWHAVDLIRGLTLVGPTWESLVHVGYFVAWAILGLVATQRRLQKLFLL